MWFGLTRLFSYYLAGHPLSTAYPILDGLAFFLAGAGLKELSPFSCRSQKRAISRVRFRRASARTAGAFTPR